MTVTISPEKMAVYRATARKKAAHRKAALDVRHNHAWETAHIAARMLREDFDAQKVVVFGSLLNRRRFHERSDIDLAAWGIPERRYLRAVCQLLDLDPEFSFDLVRMEEAYEDTFRVSLVKTIEQEGVVL